MLSGSINSDSDSSRILTSDDEGEFLEEITTDEIEITNDSDSHMCRICLENYPSNFIAPCNCRGSLQYVHKNCLDEWRLRHHATHSNRNTCQECLTPFNYRVDDYRDNFSDTSVDEIKEDFILASWFLLLASNAMIFIILIAWNTTLHRQKYNQLFFSSFVVTSGNIILVPIASKVLQLHIAPYIIWGLFECFLLWMLCVDLDMSVYIFQGVTFTIDTMFLGYHRDNF